VKVLKPQMAVLDALDECEAACCFVCEDIRPLQGAVGLIDWRMNGALTKLLKDQFYTGKISEKLLMPGSTKLVPKKVFVVGLGPTSTLTEMSLSRSVELASQTLQLANVQSAVLACSEVTGPLHSVLPALIERTFRNLKLVYFE
jgi:hypothetical protein